MMLVEKRNYYITCTLFVFFAKDCKHIEGLDYFLTDLVNYHRPYGRCPPHLDSFFFYSLAGLTLVVFLVPANRDLFLSSSSLIIKNIGVLIRERVFYNKMNKFKPFY